MNTVLVLASSPQDQGQLHLGKESKVIARSRESARNRDQFAVVSCMATTPDDLRSYLLEHSPSVVHFCGHGAGPDGLCFEADDGSTQLVSGASLAKLFHLVATELQCVVLSACYSEEQARPISEHIDFVVGMSKSIGDDAALKFAEGFYQAVWAGKSFEQAFKFGCSAIDTAGLPDEQIPILLRSPRLGGSKLYYGERVQRLENFLLRYLNSSPDARVPLTVEGERIRGLLREHYRGTILPVFFEARVLSLEETSPGILSVHTIVREPRSSADFFYYIQEKGEDFLVYWEASVGHWEVPAKTIFALSSRDPVLVRVFAQLGDHFNYEYTPEEYLSVSTEDIEGNHMTVYVDRRTSDCERLLDVLRDGRQHRLCLRVAPGYPGRRSAELVEFIGLTWVVAGANRESV